MKGILISFLPSVDTVKGCVFCFQGHMDGCILSCWFFVVFVQNNGWETPPHEQFKLTFAVKNISFQKVQSKRMERGYAVLNRPGVLFEADM